MKLPMRTIILAVLVMAAAVAAPPAEQDASRFVTSASTRSPRAKAAASVTSKGPHVHIYAANKLEYRDHRDNNVFVGDPVAYG